MQQPLDRSSLSSADSSDSSTSSEVSSISSSQLGSKVKEQYQNETRDSLKRDIRSIQSKLKRLQRDSSVVADGDREAAQAKLIEELEASLERKQLRLQALPEQAETISPRAVREPIFIPPRQNSASAPVVVPALSTLTSLFQNYSNRGLPPLEEIMKRLYS